MTPAPGYGKDDRVRLSLDLSPALSLLLDHVATVTGSPKSQLVMGVLVEALPSMLERAEGLQKRAAALEQAHRQAQQKAMQGGKR